jgi:hypothetical protein
LGYRFALCRRHGGPAAATTTWSAAAFIVSGSTSRSIHRATAAAKEFGKYSANVRFFLTQLFEASHGTYQRKRAQGISS